MNVRMDLICFNETVREVLLSKRQYTYVIFTFFAWISWSAVIPSFSFNAFLAHDRRPERTRKWSAYRTVYVPRRARESSKTLIPFQTRETGITLFGVYFSIVTFISRKEILQLFKSFRNLKFYNATLTLSPRSPFRPGNPGNPWGPTDPIDPLGPCTPGKPLAPVLPGIPW